VAGFAIGESMTTDRLRRIGLWFASLVVGVALFSLAFCVFFHTGGSLAGQPVILVFRIAMMFAFPVSCLCLPFVIALKHPEGRRIWTTLIGGSLIGPASLALWALILLLRGGDPQVIWYGDPLLGAVGGVAGGMVFGLIVGFLTTSCYLVALRALNPQANR
jgi:hypothetical protein